MKKQLLSLALLSICASPLTAYGTYRGTHTSNKSHGTSRSHTRNSHSGMSHGMGMSGRMGMHGPGMSGHMSGRTRPTSYSEMTAKQQKRLNTMASHHGMTGQQVFDMPHEQRRTMMQTKREAMRTKSYDQLPKHMQERIAQRAEDKAMTPEELWEKKRSMTPEQREAKKQEFMQRRKQRRHEKMGRKMSRRGGSSPFRRSHTATSTSHSTGMSDYGYGHTGSAHPTSY